VDRLQADSTKAECLLAVKQTALPKKAYGISGKCRMLVGHRAFQISLKTSKHQKTSYQTILSLAVWCLTFVLEHCASKWHHKNCLAEVKIW